MGCRQLKSKQSKWSAYRAYFGSKPSPKVTYIKKSFSKNYAPDITLVSSIFFKKIEKKKLSSSEPESLPLPKKLKPVASAKIINPSGNSSQDIEVGDRVRHDRFGVGEVIFLDGTDPENIKAKVKFVTEGEKNLILKFAKLTKI